VPIIILTILAQIFCAYHVVSTGRDKYWIGLIIMVPGLGCLIYFVTQILPDAGKSRTAGTAKNTVLKSIDPMREYREAMQAYGLVESTENRLRLADALYELEKYNEAEPYLVQSLVGAHKSDPHILMRLASVRLHQSDAPSALALLDQLQQDNPGFHSQDGHMLYSKALEQDGQTEEALKSFSALTDYATGEEARVRYADLLVGAGYPEDARVVYDEVIKRVDRGTKLYRKAQQNWREKALQGLERV